MRVVRVTLVGFALGLGLLGACGDDTGNGGGGSSSGAEPSTCPPTPCTANTVCYQPAAGENCNGTWYCWSDQKWHCAPEESGGPGDANITFESSVPEAAPEAAPPSESGAEGAGD